MHRPRHAANEPEPQYPPPNNAATTYIAPVLPMGRAPVQPLPQAPEVTVTEPPNVRVPDVAASLIRTWVPIAAGALLTWVASRFGLAFDIQTSATIATIATALCAAGYYALARILEAVGGQATAARIARRLGSWMLGGVIKKPMYLTAEELDALRRCGLRQ